VVVVGVVVVDVVEEVVDEMVVEELDVELSGATELTGAASSSPPLHAPAVTASASSAANALRVIRSCTVAEPTG
ncbi:MAG: hypothetical protein AAGE98_03020, partial [Actinomycetota bacterium]